MISKENIPNILSLGRLLSVPVLVFLLIMDNFSWAFIVMFLFALSDILDGYLARLWSATSRFGAALDPIADKFFIATLVGVLVLKGHVPQWLACIIVGRDLLILLSVGLLTVCNMMPNIKPMFLSKMNTALQLIYLGGVLVFEVWSELKIFFDHPAYTIALNGCDYLVALLTICSGLAYVYQVYKQNAAKKYNHCAHNNDPS